MLSRQITFIQGQKTVQLCFYRTFIETLFLCCLNNLNCTVCIPSSVFHGSYLPQYSKLCYRSLIVRGWNCRVIKSTQWFGLEATLRIIYFQMLCCGQRCCPLAQVVVLHMGLDTTNVMCVLECSWTWPSCVRAS